jgi:hypothetical protein
VPPIGDYQPAAEQSDAYVIPANAVTPITW